MASARARIFAAIIGRLQLAGRTHYREVTHCWVERRTGGGAHAIRLPMYSGRAICALCLLDIVGPTTGSDPVPKVTQCDRCEDASGALFLEVTSCWVLVRKLGAHGITRARYSGLALCRRCLFQAEQGEQLELFQ